MGIIEKHEGCTLEQDIAGTCWGPIGDYYTIFGTHLGFLKNHIIVSIVLGLAFFGTIFLLNKKEIIKVPLYLSIILSVLVTTIFFLIFAYFFPVEVLY